MNKSEEEAAEILRVLIENPMTLSFDMACGRAKEWLKRHDVNKYKSVLDEVKSVKDSSTFTKFLESPDKFWGMSASIACSCYAEIYTVCDALLKYHNIHALNCSRYTLENNYAVFATETKGFILLTQINKGYDGVLQYRAKLNL